MRILFCIQSGMLAKGMPIVSFLIPRLVAQAILQLLMKMPIHRTPLEPRTTAGIRTEAHRTRTSHENLMFHTIWNAREENGQ